jgi:hypothetical protein
MSIVIKLDDFKPLQLMAFGDPKILFKTEPESIIALAFETKQFGKETSIPIQLAMIPERAAALLRLLEDLRDRGMLPDAGGEVEQRWRQ